MYGRWCNYGTSWGRVNVSENRPFGEVWELLVSSVIYPYLHNPALTAISGSSPAPEDRRPPSELTGTPEYWLPHVDSHTYEEVVLHYSAVLYLADQGADFTGGEFRTAGGDNFRPRHNSLGKSEIHENSMHGKKFVLF